MIRSRFFLSLAALAVLSVPAVSRGAGLDAMPADDRARFDALAARVAASWDSSRGGFVDRGGVPSASAVELALTIGGEPWRSRAIATTEWTMATLSDTIGGGYLNSARDQQATSGALTKRTDSNSRRLELLLRLARETGDPRYAREAARVADYMERVLLDGRGGFVAGQTGDRDLQGESNGIAIHAWLHWALAKNTPAVRDFALRSLDVVWEHCVTDGPLMRFNVFHEAASQAQLVDQVEMGRAFVLASRLAGRARDRERAIALGDIVLGVYEIRDGKKGGFCSRASMNGKGEVKGDGREAEENARTALFLAELAHLTGAAKYRDGARRAIAAFGDKVEKMDLDAADWALAVRALSADDGPSQRAWNLLAQTQAKRSAPPRAKRYRTGAR